MSISDYKKRLQGQSIRQSILKNTAQSTSGSFASSPSYVLVNFNDSPNETGAQIVADIKNPSIKYMTTLTEHNEGDHFLLDGEYWLCKDKDKTPYNFRFLVVKCTLLLKWIDDSGSIHTYPCILEYNTKSNFGEKEDKIMALPDGRRQVIIRKDVHSIKLGRRNRFIIGNEAFSVIDYDFTSDPGLVNLSLKTTQINNAEDNLQLGIADYYSNKPKYELTFKTEKSVSIDINQKLKIDIQAKKNGTIVSPNEILLSLSDGSMGSIDSEMIFTPARTGKVSVLATYEGIAEQIDILVRETVVNNYSVDILGPDSIYLGSSASYTIQFKNNGLLIDSTALIEVDDKSLFTKIATERNSISLYANTKKQGTVNIIVTSENGFMVGSKSIRVRGYL